MSDRYYVYLLSFSVIGLPWLVHHRLFRHVSRADEPLVFLMVVAALLFPSAVPGRYGNERVTVALYAAAMAVAGALMTGLTVLVQHRNLLSATSTIEGIRRGMWRVGP